MSLSITQRPTKTISGETSNWNAVGNPIVYKLKRADYTWTVLSNNGGFARILIFGVNVTADFPNGTEVHVIGDAGTIDFISTVTAASFTGGNTLVTFAEPYTVGSSANGVANLTSRTLYRASINLYNSDDELINAEPFIYSPDSKGHFTINVSTIVKTNLIADNEIDLGTDVVFDDANIYQNFYLGYTEIWTGSSESEVTDDANLFFGVFGGMQIPSLYGGNMALYVTFEDGSPRGLFLNKLTRPKVWRNYPFSLSLIIGDTISVETFFNVQYFDVDGTLVGSQGSANDDYSGKVYQFCPNEALAIPSDAVTGRMWLANNDTAALITDYLYFDIVESCKNPVYLMVRNSLGGVLQWMFDGSQEYSHDYNDGRKAKRLVLTAENLTINEWESLQDFIRLGEVYKNNILEFDSSVIKSSSIIGQQVYDVDTEGNKIGVIVIPTRNTARTRNIKHIFEIEIEYPEEFVP